MPKGVSVSRDVEPVELLRMKRECMHLRLKSWSHASLADRFGIAPSTVKAWLTEMTLYCLPETETEELRAQEAAKIDADELTANQAIDMLIEQGRRITEANGNVAETLEAIRRWEQFKHDLRNQRAKMMGLNKPVQVLHAVKIRTEFDAEIETLVAELLGGGKLLSTPDQVLVNE